MPEGAEEGPAVVLLLGDLVVLGEGGAGAGQGGRQARKDRTVVGGGGALGADSGGRG